MVDSGSGQHWLAVQKRKHHLLWAMITFGLLALTLILFTVSSAETQTTYVCIGSAVDCNVTKVSALGWFCGAGGIVTTLCMLLALRSWIAEIPRA